MELKRPKAILFDWDNTLVNTWPVIHEALHNTFVTMGREPWSIEMVRARVSRSMRDSFPELFGENWHKAGELYQKNFRDIHLQKLQALPQAEEVLKFLHGQDVYVAVVSNKKGDNLRLEAGHIGWNPYFSKLIGADDTPKDKPSHLPVEAALEGSGIGMGEHVWFIGDSVIDMECAHVTKSTPVWYGDLPATPLAYPHQHHAPDHQALKDLLTKVF